jgi:hypothetical protein
MKLLILFSVIVISCSSGDKTNSNSSINSVPLKDTSKAPYAITEEDKEFEEAWKIFANAVLSADLKQVKQLSSSCIHCTDCVTNTRQEDSLFKKFQSENPDTWYEKLNSKFCYVPIDKFLKEDFAIVFESVGKSRMLIASKISYHNDSVNKGMYDKKCIVSSMELKNGKIMEMFVKVVDPSSETEGMSKTFAFIQTKQGYKFCGYSTVP